MWRNESNQCEYQTLSVALVRRLRIDMWLCKQGARAQCALPHRHAGNTLSMVVLPGGQCKQANKCLSCTNTHAHTQKEECRSLYVSTETTLAVTCEQSGWVFRSHWPPEMDQKLQCQHRPLGALCPATVRNIDSAFLWESSGQYRLWNSKESYYLILSSTTVQYLYIIFQAGNKKWHCSALHQRQV